MDIYKRIKELGFELPPAPPKGGIYKPVKQSGNLCLFQDRERRKTGSL